MSLTEAILLGPSRTKKVSIDVPVQATTYPVLKTIPIDTAQKFALDVQSSSGAIPDENGGAWVDVGHGGGWSRLVSGLSLVGIDSRYATPSRPIAMCIEGIPKWYVHVNGDVEARTLAAGIILSSPDGTRWRVTVSNAGEISAAAAPAATFGTFGP